ncbi:MAG: PHP domain-containing protein [Dehalococcoidia bacterium]|jgi:predicted metal-dependent phosphoesterase TrpH|nr:PHP domain-containing protein [Dehalococcoidia bacterium]MDW8009047.1 PHP-associated domain-containing protein [Chloroflexota bacterium]
MSEQRLGKADLHVHTSLSDGMASPQEVLDYVQEHTDLDVVAITDHDSLDGAWAVREAWAKGRYRFDVVVGMEVTAIEGHIIALFVESPLPSLRPAAEVVEAIHRQGGLAIIAHPLSLVTRSLNRRDIERLMSLPQALAHADGMEVANGFARSLPFMHGRHRIVQELADRYRLARVGGSDAHFRQAIGSAYTLFPGRSAEDLRRAILERATAAASGRHPRPWELGLWPLLVQQWRGLTVTPRTLGLGATAMSFVQRIFPFLRPS